MKQKLSTFIQPLMVIAALAIIVSVASAWTGPTGTFPDGNVNAPLNTGGIDQSKIGNLGTLKSFIAGDSIGAGSLMLGNKGAFGCNGTPCWNANYAAANTDKLRAGVFDSAGAFLKGLVINQAGKSLIGTGNTTTGNFNGVVVDPTGDFSVGKRTSWLTNGLYVSGQTGGVAITGPLAIPTGNPGAGKVLTSDATGNASWGGSSVQVKLMDAGDVKVYRSSWYNNGNTIIHEGSAVCDPGYMAISGGVDCEPNGDGSLHSVQISEPGKINGGAYAYTTSGSGNGTMSTEYPRSWRGKCGASNSNSSLDFHVTVVCMKVNTNSSNLVTTTGTPTIAGGGSSGGGTITSSGTTWHDVTKATGTAGQTCAQWLAGYPNFSGSNTNVRVSGVLGGIPLSLDQGCAYTRTVSGTTYCASGDFNTGKSLVIGGVSTGLAPTATCSGVDLNSTGQQVVTNWKTQIQY